MGTEPSKHDWQRLTHMWGDTGHCKAGKPQMLNRDECPHCGSAKWRDGRLCLNGVDLAQERNKMVNMLAHLRGAMKKLDPADERHRALLNDINEMIGAFYGRNLERIAGRAAAIAREDAQPHED